jgi:hypothetical protein
MGVPGSSSRTWPESVVELGGAFKIVLHPGVSLGRVDAHPELRIEAADRMIVVEHGVGLISRSGLFFKVGSGADGHTIFGFMKKEVKSVERIDGETVLWPKQQRD